MWYADNPVPALLFIQLIPSPLCLAVLTALQLLYTLWVVLSMCVSCCSGNRPSSGAHRGYVPLSGGSGPRGV